MPLQIQFKVAKTGLLYDYPIADMPVTFTDLDKKQTIIAMDKGDHAEIYTIAMDKVVDIDEIYRTASDTDLKDAKLEALIKGNEVYGKMVKTKRLGIGLLQVLHLL